MAIIKCPHCGQPVSDNAKICPHCGKQVTVWYCPECDNEIVNRENDCPFCGNNYLNFRKRVFQPSSVEKVSTLNKEPKEIIGQEKLNDREASRRSYFTEGIWRYVIYALLFCTPLTLIGGVVNAIDNDAFTGSLIVISSLVALFFAIRVAKNDEDMFEFLKDMGDVGLILLGCGSLITTLCLWLFDAASSGVVILCAVVGIILFLFRIPLHKSMRKCDVCGTKEEPTTYEEYIDERVISRVEDFDRFGNKCNPYTVFGTEYHYIVHSKCKKCGHETQEHKYTKEWHY